MTVPLALRHRSIRLSVRGDGSSRRAGARHTITERVWVARREGRTVAGWGINICRYGVRVILEGGVFKGDEVDIVVGTLAPRLVRRARVVWVQREKDGTVAGLEFVELPSED